MDAANEVQKELLKVTGLLVEVRQDLGNQLDRARREHRLAELRAEAKRLHQAKRWEAVVAVGAQLSALDPERSDPDGLISSAGAELEMAERSRLLAIRYQEAPAHGRWFLEVGVRGAQGGPGHRRRLWG
jgi:hypothetical protein